MPRSYYIEGPCMVYVKGGAHLSGRVSAPDRFVELGLSRDGINVTPTFYHREIRADDFGPQGTPEVHWMLATANISMTLVHYDAVTLDYCYAESMGGSLVDINFSPMLVGAGTPLGKMLPLYASGNNYVSVYILPSRNNEQQRHGGTAKAPWFFPACYMTGAPFTMTHGALRVMPRVDFRCIPYNIPLTSGPVSSGQTHWSGEIVSSGAILWTRQTQILG